MRKLMGVVMAGVLPMACGTIPTEPSAAVSSAPAEVASFTSAARGAPACSDKADWSAVRGVVVSVVRRGKDSVTVRADLMWMGGSGPTPCYTTTFAVKPFGRGITLTRERDPREATLRAPDGTYAILATAEGAVKPAHTGGIQVQLPDGK